MLLNFFSLRCYSHSPILSVYYHINFQDSCIHLIQVKSFVTLILWFFNGGTLNQNIYLQRFFYNIPALLPNF